MKLFHSIIRLTLIFFISGLIFTSCSKSSDSNGNNNTSGYYLTATVDGKAWASNVNFNTFNSPVLAGITPATGTNVFFLLGLKANNKDTSGLVVIFPENTTLNKLTNFDVTKTTEGAYITETAPGSAVYNGFNTTPTTGGSGSFTITLIDETNKILEGSFSGTFGSTTNNGSKVQITDGKFRCPYTTDFSQVTSVSGSKF